jgi:hypothetical protein
VRSVSRKGLPGGWAETSGQSKENHAQHPERQERGEAAARPDNVDYTLISIWIDHVYEKFHYHVANHMHVLTLAVSVGKMQEKP